MRPLNLRVSIGYLVGSISGRGLEAGAPASEAAGRQRSGAIAEKTPWSLKTMPADKDESKDTC